MSTPAQPTPPLNRRRRLRRTEDCLALLEAARVLGATVVTPGVAHALGGRFPEIGAGAPIDAALASVAEAQREAEKLARDRRLLHRRPAFDHRILIDDLVPPPAA